MPRTEYPIDHEALRARAGSYLYQLRMNIQAYHAAATVGQGRTYFHPENMPIIRRVLNTGLRATGTYWWGRRNARTIRVRENHVSLRRLPDAFSGFRLLQISDIHLDLYPAVTDALIERVRDAEYDLCVITGDFRAETWGGIGPALTQAARLIPHIKTPVYAVLGNHDFLEMVQPLERIGCRMLINERVAIDRDSAAIYIVGIDDPHFYETDNLEKATDGLPQEATKILLSHSAEPYRVAQARGIDLMLCGHTHGGQICLPGGFAPVRNARQPRYMNNGPWSFHELTGYTSSGAGVCMVPVRFFCPPEVTIHVLGRTPPA